MKQMQQSTKHNDNTKLDLQQKKQQCTMMRLTQYISDANPIQKRQKLKPNSILPLMELPLFKYLGQQSEPTSINDPINTQQTSLILQCNSLAQIFKSPIFVYSEKASMKNNNQFGCINTNCEESKYYPFVKNPQTIIESIKLNKKNIKNMDVRKVKQTKKQFQPEIRNQNYQQHQVQSELQTFYSMVLNQNQQLYFQSHFESGNLCFATPVPDDKSSYYLICTRDYNTTKCTQWFFFKTINKRPGKVTFHILNFIKPYSAFSNGMKICYASKSNDYKWARGCTDIKYRKTNLQIYAKNSEQFYYCLSFTYNYTTSQDNVYFSYCYPYTYSMLQDFLFHQAEINPYAKRRTITTTLGNNNVDLITITNFKNKNKKRTVLITSRVHPGETPSSFICEGMMKYLMGNSEQAQILRQNFVFKFVPMLNPDGVINGSYRCSLSGYDLNRVWNNPNKNIHPQIYETCKVINQIIQNQKIFLFIDLHAHSKKKGIFVYGCQNKAQPYVCRQIPFLFWKNIPNFNYHQCNFAMKTGRQGTSRLHLYQKFNIDYSYTFQHSFCGPSRQRVHFTSQDYSKIGIQYLLTLYKYFGNKHQNFQQQETAVFQQLYTNKQLLKIGDTQNESSSSDQQLDKQRKPQQILQNQIIERNLEIKGQKKARSLQKIQQNSRSSIMRLSKKNQTNLSEKKQFVVKKKVNALLQQTSKKLPIVGPNLLQKQELKDEIDQKLATFYEYNRQRKCFSSVGSYGYGISPTKQQNSQSKPNGVSLQKRQSFRYEDSVQIANGLSNLFLPSLTRASYQKYMRKNPNFNLLLNSNTNLIDNAKFFKQEIKPMKKKPPSWKDHAKSYL